MEYFYGKKEGPYSFDHNVIPSDQDTVDNFKESDHLIEVSNDLMHQEVLNADLNWTTSVTPLQKYASNNEDANSFYNERNSVQQEPFIQQYKMDYLNLGISTFKNSEAVRLTSALDKLYSLNQNELSSMNTIESYSSTFQDGLCRDNYMNKSNYEQNSNLAFSESDVEWKIKNSLLTSDTISLISESISGFEKSNEEIIASNENVHDQIVPQLYNCGEFKEMGNYIKLYDDDMNTLNVEELNAPEENSVQNEKLAAEVFKAPAPKRRRSVNKTKNTYKEEGTSGATSRDKDQKQTITIRTPEDINAGCKINDNATKKFKGRRKPVSKTNKTKYNLNESISKCEVLVPHPLASTFILVMTPCSKYVKIETGSDRPHVFKKKGDMEMWDLAAEINARKKVREIRQGEFIALESEEIDEQIYRVWLEEEKRKRT